MAPLPLMTCSPLRSFEAEPLPQRSQVASLTWMRPGLPWGSMRAGGVHRVAPQVVAELPPPDHPATTGPVCRPIRTAGAGREPRVRGAAGHVDPHPHAHLRVVVRESGAPPTAM